MKNNRRRTRYGVRHAAACAVAVLALAGCASRAPAPVADRALQPAPAVAVPEAVKDSYTVKSGDTLYSIARDHGMDYRDLIAMNAIDSPSRITPGRVLKVRPPGTQDSTSSVVSTAPITTDVVVARPLGGNTDTLKREPKAGKEAYSDLALAQAQGQGKPGETAAPLARAESRPEIKPEATPETRPEGKPGEAALSGDELNWIWPATGKVVATFSEGGSKGVDIAGKAGDPVVAAAGGKVVYSGTGLRGYGKLVIIKHNNTYLSAYAHNQTILVKEGQTVSKSQKIAEMGNSDADQVKLHFEVRRQGKPVDPLKYLPQP